MKLTARGRFLAGFLAILAGFTVLLACDSYANWRRCNIDLQPGTFSYNYYCK
jgi:hypothetical protein